MNVPNDEAFLEEDRYARRTCDLLQFSGLDLYMLQCPVSKVKRRGRLSPLPVQKELRGVIWNPTGFRPRASMGMRISRREGGRP